MSLDNIEAKPHSTGNRIDLSWLNSDPDQFPGVRVMRRQGTYPVRPEIDLFLLTDLSLQSDLDNETVSPALRQAFLDNFASLPDNVAILAEAPGSKWRIRVIEPKYVILQEGGGAGVYLDEDPVPALPLLRLDTDFQTDFDDEIISLELWELFAAKNLALPLKVHLVAETPGSTWRLMTVTPAYTLRRQDDQLTVFDEAPLVKDTGLFSLAGSFGSDLDNGTISADLRHMFSLYQTFLSDLATISVELPGDQWRIIDKAQAYIIKRYDLRLNVYLAADTRLFSLIEDFQSDLDSETISVALQQQFSAHQIILSDGAAVAIVRPDSLWKITDQDQAYVVRKYDLTLYVYAPLSTFVADRELKGETTYYYTLFPHHNDPPDYHVDSHNRIAALATAPYDLAGQMFNQLPGVYHRYDTVLAAGNIVPAADRQKGQLRRFLDLPGEQLDQIYSFAGALPDLTNLDKIDGRLLSLLAQWIGWQTDFRQEFDNQRNEIRDAPSIYQTIGIVPTVEATVKRILGWESRVKEFVHNVCLTNRPEQLNLWIRHRNEANEWPEPTNPLSLDFAYEGRPALVNDNNGTYWLFYQTLKDEQWDIWYKTWTGSETDSWAAPDLWQPSQPLTQYGDHDRHPAAAAWDGALWVFWDAYDKADRTWRVDYRIYRNNNWSATLTLAAEGETPTERKSPAVVADPDNNQLWLFWLERAQGNAAWQLEYQRYDDPSAMTLSPDSSLTLNNGAEFGLEQDLFLLFHDQDAAQPLWLFWAYQETTGGRWHVAYRVKTSLDPTASDWDVVRPLPKDGPPPYDDREPAAILITADTLDLFWSSNQGGNWSIRQRNLAGGSHTWGTAEQITSPPYSQRTPFPLAEDAIIYRSNRSLTYSSSIYRATETVDHRYAGSTTVDAGNEPKRALWGQFDDFQTYIYDAGENQQPDDQDWYARDTVGIYLTPDTDNSTLILHNQNLIKDAIKQFLPIQVRPVFIIEPTVYRELVYTYSFQETRPPWLDEDEPLVERVIIEHFHDDSIEGRVTESYTGPADDYQDTVNWIWLLTWSPDNWDPTNPTHLTVDVNVTPINRTYRTWHTNLEAGG